MIRPANFGYNEETAASNAFQTNANSRNDDSVKSKAIEEFNELVIKLIQVGVDVIVFEDSDNPIKPDAVFPNNWITFHQDGTIVTYPMLSPVRRMERRDDIVNKLMNRFQVKKKIQLEEYETIDQFLEGTGSMIIDRTNGLVYACLSPRTSSELLLRFCKLMDYMPITFHAVDGKGQEIYHTNVMMALGETFVVICRDTIKNLHEREMLENKFKSTGKKIIDISLDQMMAFAGNMLQVRNKDGKTYLVLSQQAYDSLNSNQINLIHQHTDLLYSPIPTIETYGGGSVRCMMAEIFLPEK
jgi:hypothetical protein